MISKSSVIAKKSIFAILFILLNTFTAWSTSCIASSASLGSVVARSLPSCIISRLPDTSRYCSSGSYCFTGCQCSLGTSSRTYLVGTSRFSSIFPLVRLAGNSSHTSFHNCFSWRVSPSHIFSSLKFSLCSL